MLAHTPLNRFYPYGVVFVPRCLFQNLGAVYLFFCTGIPVGKAGCLKIVVPKAPDTDHRKGTDFFHDIFGCLMFFSKWYSYFNVGGSEKFLGGKWVANRVPGGRT